MAHETNRTITRPGPLRGFFIGVALALFASAPATADVNIANSPLFVTSSVEPNLMFIIDDSGSMQWEVMPDELTTWFSVNIAERLFWLYPRVNNLHGDGDYNNVHIPLFTGNTAALIRSSHNNTVFYNPAVTYRPWSNPDGTLMPPASPTAAPNRPLFPVYGTRDLTVEATHNRWRTDTGAASTATLTYFPAVYYHYNGGDIALESSYTRVEIRPLNAPFIGHGRENRSDCVLAPACTYAEEIQNFANWYTYHRNRIFASRAGIGSAFARFDGGMRVGYGTINHNRTTLTALDGVNGRTVVRGVRTFTGASKIEFFDELYNRPIPSTGTPLRRALEGAGEYFARSDDRGPWSSTPGEAGGEDLSCRQSFSILMTDGYTSGGSDWQATDASRRANNDGTTVNNTVNNNPTGPNYQYTPTDPYRDGMSNTLADVAMYYWKRDLRPDLPNRVPTSERNPAFWQHMVTYGVGLGVVGSIDPDDAWAAAEAGTPIAWPDPQFNQVNCSGANCPARIDDLLHAAINSRGGFFSAQDPETFANELTLVIDDIVARVESSATAAATSSAVLQTDTLLYTAGFRSGDWSGQLIGREVNDDGTVGALVWNAETLLAGVSPGMREIFTVNSATGDQVELDLGLLSASQIAALNTGPDNTADALGAARIEWLRGDESIPGFRSRSESGAPRLLGDIINSNPQYAGQTDFGYRLLPGAEGTSYATFRASPGYANRPDVIYVGANSGMLHGFNAATGVEMFAYMPSELLLPEPGRDHAPVSRLMAEDYSHRYFMDGTPIIRDAFVNGAWRTVLVGTMGAGGRTVFALDVTNPSNASVLWEFTHPELGYKVGQPAMTRLRDGRWAAIFGNGYNSASHTAGLFVVDLDDGSLIQRIDTGIGSAGDPNGMAAPAVTDYPFSDLLASRVYAGDLQGNLWRFELSSTDPSDWSAAASRRVLFSAINDDGERQPITVRPALALLPGHSDTVVVGFGTGSYFQEEDAVVVGAPTQSLYGIFDRNTTVSDRSELLEQVIEEQTTETFTTPDGPREFDLRIISEETIDLATHRGWYIDLVYGGDNQGERVVSAGTFPSGRTAERIRFTTLIPDSDPCGTGRRGYLMDIDLLTGGRFDVPVFDLTGDGVIDDADLKDGLPPSGVGFGAGELPTTIRRRDVNLEGIYTGEGENIDGLTGDVIEGRQSWRQLR
ncbi:MAG: pilus assembly protein PilY [Gammaproteobacteria bacterium]|nr:pilus assembly protein PilY [Gammaproteobacteria bacterium]